MTIPTQMSLAGFIATDPEPHFTTAGAEYVRVRVGIEQWRKEVDGSFTELEPTFHDMVAFDAAARMLCDRFRRGDSFIAAGYLHEYEVERPGTGSVVKDEFVARKIGHNANKTAYDIQRRRPPAAEPPAAPLPAQPAAGQERSAPVLGA